MSPIRSIKSRWRDFFETHALFRPVGQIIRIILAGKFKFVSLLQRFWILLRLIKIRIQYGKKLIVIYRGIGIGDIVCTFPLVAEIRKQFPDHRIIYVTNRQSRAFVEKYSGADQAIATSYGFYSLPLPLVPAWVATKAHFPRYIGERGDQEVSVRTGYISEMAASFGISLSQPRPAIAVDKDAAASSLRHFGAGESTRPFIGIHLGPTLPVREYPFASWQELVSRMQKELGATIFRFGSKIHHTSESTEMIGQLPVQFDFTDRLELIETTELLSAMDLFIGIDSGLLHIANAVHIPTIGLFGPTDPTVVLAETPGIGLFAKELPCIFCQHRRLNLHWQTGCPFDIQCMKQLSVDSILLQARSILEASGLLPTRAT